MADLQTELGNLIDMLVAQYGYMVFGRDREKIVSSESYRAEDFARDVLVADGLNVDENLGSYRKVRNLFVERFGHFVCTEDFEEHEKI